ncbi:MAG: ornithine carbamoyltransferase [Thermoplasmata archaeon]|nr:MAG: ornithine carbamoyltransferase [Thermoplasmata archaeon]
MTRHLISVADLAGRLEQLIDRAIDMKRAFKSGDAPKVLDGRALAMIFEKPSTRTRVSFEVGMHQLGGHGLFLSPNDLQMGRGETVEDTARVLSRFVDAIMYRAFDHGVMEQLAGAATVPVINALDDLEHPCQIVADLMTIKEHFGRLKGVTVAYVGDGNNVANSLAIGCALVGANLKIGTPAGYDVDKGILQIAQDYASANDCVVETGRDPAWAVGGADVVYTDVWTSMGDEAEEGEREAIFAPYQVNAELMHKAAPGAKFMHCLPAHRGHEVTDEVVDADYSIVLDQAENRLHGQKAILVDLILGSG